MVWWDKRPPLEPSFKLTDFIATPRVKFLPLLKSVEVEQQLVSLAKWPGGGGGPSCAADGTIIQGTGVLGSWWWTAARNCEWIWNGIYGTDYSRPPV